MRCYKQRHPTFDDQHGGKCTFNQTKVLSASQVERAFGGAWEQFKAARETADPDRRFLSGCFETLTFGAAPVR